MRAGRAARRAWRAAPSAARCGRPCRARAETPPAGSPAAVSDEASARSRGPGKADERARLCQIDVAEEPDGRGHPARRRVGEHGDAWHASLPEPRQRGRHLGHLHEREDALLEACPARGGADDEWDTGGPGVLDEARETLADARSHAAAEEGEVEDPERHPMPADARRAGEDRLPASGLPARRREAGGVTRERDRIGRSQAAIALRERPGVDEEPHARLGRQPQVVAAVRAHLETARPAIEGLGAGWTTPGSGGQLSTHGRAAACIAARREAMNAATLPGAPRASPSSTSRPIALPTITASAKPAIQPACSAVLTPKPTPTGSRVTRRTRLISSGSSRGSAARAPVVPSTETK